MNLSDMSPRARWAQAQVMQHLIDHPDGMSQPVSLAMQHLDDIGAILTPERAEEIAAEAAPELEKLRARVAELETFAHGCDAEGCVLPHSSWCERAKKAAVENGGCTCPQPWEGSPQPHTGSCWLLSPPRDEVERLRRAHAEVLAKLDCLRAQKRFLLEQVRRKDAASGEGNRALAAFLAEHDVQQGREPEAPRTERSRWQAIADALNAVPAIGVDLDGTITDHLAWSVVWDRAAKRWVVAGADERDAQTGGAS